MSEMFQTSRFNLRVLDPTKNKKAQYMLRKYLVDQKSQVFVTIYGKPCNDNVKEYYHLRDDMFADNGFDFRCCAYQVPAYGDLTYLIYHTRDNVYCIAIPKPYGKA